MKWTTEQQKVIDLRNRNILVSAAAGSGKTAVLVERIISMITEGDNPIDIDRLLIVTFTNAAAAEMRERIGAAIDRKLEEMPDNVHLQKQVTLIHSAWITTIHSFCLNVIRNHFNTIDLDPSFRIADEAELTLIKSDVISELLENYYEEANENFLDFIESFSTGKTDQAIEDLILKLHSFSMSYPWPEEWLDERKNTFSIEAMEDMKNTDWMSALLQHIHTVVSDLIIRSKEAIRISNDADGPKAYIPALSSDITLLHELEGITDYEQYMIALDEFSFARLSSKREEGVSDDKKNQVKLLREEVKKAITDLKKNYFFQPAEEMLKDIKAMKSTMEVLIQICKDFSTLYANKKTEKNIVDFNDLEHFALNILVKKEEGKIIPTPAADELSEYFAEIMIDEYQDSNFVQETILNSISKERFGKPNLFMVGDVKQSIYKFRLARPEIFMEKFDKYELTDSLYQRVDLHKNFRSRDVVLSSINFIFEQIMTKKLGNIEYDEKVALYPGADYGSLTTGISTDTEVLLVSVDPPEIKQEDVSKLTAESEDNELGSFEDYTAKEIEAKAIAKRIKELTDPESGLLIYDRKKETYKRATNGDIVILLRTISGWAEVFSDTLATEGIMAHTETQSGYFSTLEIRTILNLLRIIDNPRQDIPFTAILRSPIVGLSSDELSLIRIKNRRMSMYEAVTLLVEEYNESVTQEADKIIMDEQVVEITCMDNVNEYNSSIGLKDSSNQNNEVHVMNQVEESRIQEDVNPVYLTLIQKLNKFIYKLDQYRDMVYYLSIHELILKVLEDTGYYNYVYAMPTGDKRKANIDMLVQRAIRFESTSYSGLFHFIRYIEKLHKYDIDFGEAKIVSENDNTVKIMSIHKSKGLEFPIVFVSGAGKSFNNQDSRSSLLIHPDLGLGPDYLNHELRVKAPTLVKKVIQKELVLENLGEELRVLYVALTRAKEKLIITGGVKNLEDKLNKWLSIMNQHEKQLLFYQLSNVSNYLDWIVPSIIRHRGFENLLKIFGKVSNDSNPLYLADTELTISQCTYEELASKEVINQIYKSFNQEELQKWNTQIIYSDEIRKQIEEHMKYQYPYLAETSIHTKLTVSELKRLGQLEADDFGVPIKGISKKEKNILIPKFMNQSMAVEGADLGTLYHTVLEYMNLLDVKDVKDIELQLDQLIVEGKLTEDDINAISKDKLYHFTTSPIASRMRKAKEQGKLYVERQFVMGMKAHEINPSMKSEELVLIQGVIDVYFEEDGRWVLLDYKTDSVYGKDGESELIKRYLVQLDYYQKALEQLTGKQVKERIIYSFGLEKEIKVPIN
jgi:ATP-dependent helicase/nuclease subunit A